MRRGTLLLLGMVPILFVGHAGRAQNRPNGVYLTSPLSLSSGYDENFFVNSKAVDDTVSILTAPGFSWIRNTHRSVFSVNYEAEFEIFARNQELNAWNHSATLRYSYRLTSRMSAEAGNSFLSTSDASRTLGDSQFLLPRGRFQQNSFFAGLKYQLNHRTRFSFRFDNTITTMALAGPQGDRFDQLTNAGTATVDHTLNRRHSVTASYAYLRGRPLNRNGSAGYSYQAANTVNAGYMYTARPSLIFRATGGVVRTGSYAYTAGGAVEKTVGDLWMMAGYQRYLSFFGGFAPSGGPEVRFANGLAPDSLFQAATLRLRGKVTRRVGLEFNGQLGRGSIGGQQVRSVIAQSRLDYKLSDRLTVFVRAEYYGQNVSQFSESPLSRRRYFGGLEVVLSRPPQTEDGVRRRLRTPAEAAKPLADEAQVPEEK